MGIDKIISIYAPPLSPCPLAPDRSSRGLHICAHFSNNNENFFNDMTELKIMYLLEIWMNKYCLWHNFKPRQSAILSNIYKNLNILFPRL